LWEHGAGALLPTVQFGSGDTEANTCAADIRANGKRPNPASAASALAARGAAAKAKVWIGEQ
jgi:hypothetical protein